MKVEYDGMARNLTKVPKDKSSSRLLKSVGFFVAVVLVATLAFSLSKPAFTGFVSTEVFATDLNLRLDESTIINLHSEQEISLKSLALSGFVEGANPVYVFAEDSDGLKHLVYSNVKKRSPLTAITGHAVSDAVPDVDEEIVLEITTAPLRDDFYQALEEDDTLEVGNFAYKCVDTCLLDPTVFRGNDFRLYVYLTEGSVLKLNSITYSAEF